MGLLEREGGRGRVSSWKDFGKEREWGGMGLLEGGKRKGEGEWAGKVLGKREGGG